MAVVELIKEGQRKGIWDYRIDIDKMTTGPEKAKDSPQANTPVISSEIRKGDKKDELVQEKAEDKGIEQAKSPTQQSDGGKTVEGNKNATKDGSKPK